jgi:hypothetical protein
MRLRLYIRLAAAAGSLGFAATPQFASAETDPAAGRLFLRALIVPAAPPRPASASETRSVPRYRGSLSTLLKRRNDGLVYPHGAAADADPVFSATVTLVPPPQSRRFDWARKLLASRAVWAVFLALGLAGSALLAKSEFPCLALGHRRSRARVRFDDQRHGWISDCKRCGRQLSRDSEGRWKLDTAAVRELRRLTPQFADRSTASEKAPAIVVPAPVVERPPVLNGANSSLAERPAQPVAAPIAAPERNARTFMLAPRGEPDIVVEHSPWPNGKEDSATGPMRRDNRINEIVDQLLEDMVSGNVASPGVRGALFFVVDELRAWGPAEQTRRAEGISIGMQQLQCALQRGDESEAKSARRRLKALAGDWMSSRKCTELIRSAPN